MSPRRQPQGGDLCTIFVHAGAGYHSHANEALHLGAVADAAKVAMAILKNGGEAKDAVEMAIRLLEDREITNAGFGSNLTIDGSVECDATMVDHLGRSGAVGCIAHVKNPIAVARLVLEASSKPLSLSRVPPNLLVGPGATDWAAEQGVLVLPHDYLVSDNARARWATWRQDLRDLEAKDKSQGKPKSKKYRLRRKDTEVNSPGTTLSPPPFAGQPNSIVSTFSGLPSPERPPHELPAAVPTYVGVHAPDPTTLSRCAVDPSFYKEYSKISGSWADGDRELSDATQNTPDAIISPAKRQRVDGSKDLSGINIEALKHSAQPLLEGSKRVLEAQSVEDEEDGEDHITDTVGAIAVDCFGNIAAGSSSGGIGMKHRGRCGPAALVGIGTAVIPFSPDDPERASVATVTSGTGEHMATTSAAATAADRIYLRARKDHGKLTSCEEEEALEAMIRNDFMKHPGVRDQPCVGAIGILAVKKTVDGIYCYFGHNTDSFALASMHSEERQPVCTMSRNKGNGSIALGGRVARTRRV